MNSAGQSSRLRLSTEKDAVLKNGHCNFSGLMRRTGDVPGYTKADKQNYILAHSILNRGIWLYFKNSPEEGVKNNRGK